MAKATKTLQHTLSYQPHHAVWFAANQVLCNRVVAFYFEVINAHEKLLDLSNQDALRELEHLTHATSEHPDPIMPLSQTADSIPAMFRRAAINAALGSARSFFTPLERKQSSPQKIATQLTNTATTLCAIDLNVGENTAVCTVQTIEGTILATTFIRGGKRVNGFRKRLLGRIARNRSKTGIIAEAEQDNAALWASIRHTDESFAHLVSSRIVQFTKNQGASILVFEHLGSLKPEKGKYSRRSNAKRAYWMKGRIFRYAKYKAWNEGILTSRVNPKNTSRQCARCHAPIIRYAQGMPQEGYRVGAPLMVCPSCGKRDNADRNASIVIGQRLIARCQEKPPTLARQEEPKGSGTRITQDAENTQEPSILVRGHGDPCGHGTAHGEDGGMDTVPSSIPPPLRLCME